MKTLRSQMNGTCESEFIQCYFIHLFILIELKMETEIELDVEDEAAKISVEEEMQLTNVRTLESDIESGHHFPSIARGAFMTLLLFYLEFSFL